MKIWKEFNSSHSSDISIVGTFETEADAKKIFEVVEDFATASWKESYPSLEAFNKHWEGKWDSGIGHYLTEEDFETGIDRTPDIELNGNVISISGFRTPQIGGIVKILNMSGATKVVVE